MERSNLEQDLNLTIQELASVYEELSLLYRLSEVLSGLSIEGICKRIIDEAINTIEVKTAAVLFLHDNGEELYTKSSRGNWDSNLRFKQDDGVLWNSIKTQKPYVSHNVSESKHGNSLSSLKSLLICPMIGKNKVLGAIVVGDKVSSENFYSNDIKLLGAIAFQAGLSIENAYLYRELEELLLGTIRSLVRALEATSKWSAGHTERVTKYAMDIGKEMGFDAETIEKLRMSSLLHDIGKIGTPKEILDKAGKLTKEEYKEISKHPIMGAEILRDLKQFTEIVEGIKYHHEHWDGSGLFGLKGEQIPLLARVLSVADAFDAMTSDRPYRPRKSKEDTIREMMEFSGIQFDPLIIEAFLRWVDTFNLLY
ncbi:MAG: HD domain-containing protein [Nitrospira sp.]|nr:HD domain-containing protein [Nitrospira sp.]